MDILTSGKNNYFRNENKGLCIVYKIRYKGRKINFKKLKFFSEAIKVSDIVIALFISAANDANGIHGVVPSIASVMPTEINFLNFQ